MTSTRARGGRSAGAVARGVDLIQEDLPDRASGHRSSVHGDHRAGDLRRPVAGQEEHGFGHVLEEDP